MNNAPKAWLTRSGKYGERDEWALANGVTPGGFDGVADLSGCHSLDDVRTLVAAAYTDASTNAVSNFAAQLWALRGAWRSATTSCCPGRPPPRSRSVGSPGTTSTATTTPIRRSGMCVRSSGFAPTSPVQRSSRTCCTRWGRFSTYCQVSRNEAAARIAAIAATGVDPGTKVAVKPLLHAKPGRSPGPHDADVPNADESRIDLEEYAQDRIAALIHEDFAGHRMAVLTEALLTGAGLHVLAQPGGR